MEITKVLELIKKTTHSSPLRITTRSQLPQTPYIYIVYNGNNILQIGKTRGGDNGGRLSSLLKGARPSIHNKSFIVGLGSVVLQGENEFMLFPVFVDKNVEEIEKEIHSKLGFRTNKQACVFFDGVHTSSISEANKILWDRYKTSGHYDFLNANEKMMAEELFNLIDSYKVRVHRRNGKSQQYSSGDILTGGILASQNLNAFANLWQKITKKYFEYTDLYLLKDADYESYLSSYKTIFTADAVSSDEFCINRVPQTNKTRKIKANLQDKTPLGVDVVILKSQVEFALNLLREPDVHKECVSSDMIFETDNPNYVLLITRPTESTGENKIQKLLSRLGDKSEIIFSNLMRTNKPEKLQYFTDIGACFIEFRANGFKDLGKRYIKQE